MQIRRRYNLMKFSLMQKSSWSCIKEGSFLFALRTSGGGGGVSNGRNQRVSAEGRTGRGGVSSVLNGIAGRGRLLSTFEFCNHKNRFILPCRSQGQPRVSTGYVQLWLALALHVSENFRGFHGSINLRVEPCARSR